MEAWHFIREDKMMRFNDHCLIEAGKTYRVEGEPRLCEHGFHASKRAIDALVYAPGPIICRVHLGGTIIEGTDKAASTERTVLWMEDATEALRNYARWCALSVAHLWDMPCGVRQYLETGDECLRYTVRDAASAANAAAMAAARATSMAAVGAVDWDAAWDAAMEKQNIELETRLNAIPHMTK